MTFRRDDQILSAQIPTKKKMEDVSFFSFCRILPFQHKKWHEMTKEIPSRTESYSVMKVRLLFSPDEHPRW